MGDLSLSSHSKIPIGQVSRLLQQNPSLWTQYTASLKPNESSDTWQMSVSRSGIPTSMGLLPPEQLKHWNHQIASIPFLPRLPVLPSLSGQTSQIGEMSGEDELGELEPEDMGPLKTPESLHQTQSGPAGVYDTGLKDKYGRPIRLTKEAATGLYKILEIAKHKGIRVEVLSAYRTVEHQQRLWNQALKKYGSVALARRWVAPPGRSRHNFGQAIDIHMYRNGRKISQKEFDQIIAQAGMYRPLPWEGWHVEPLSTRHSRGR